MGTLGDIARLERNERGMNRRSLAECAGITKDAVRRLENGTGPVDATDIERVARVLGSNSEFARTLAVGGRALGMTRTWDDAGDRERRAYIRHSTAWYAEAAPLQDNCTDDIHVGFEYDDEPGCMESAFIVAWHKIGEGYGFWGVPRIEAFSDTWKLLPRVNDVLEALAAIGDDNPTPDDVCQTLDRLGFRAITQTQRP